MSLNVPPEFERAVRERVESGEYDSPEEVFDQALMALQEAEEQARTAWLREQIDVGLADAARGETVPAAEVIERLRAKYGKGGET